ncbi:MAG: AAA family ATPase [Candidatus Lokiarchaeota archaeon]|nr:AAA family ATPase [Candidatus Lokiarchaeota archaeon]
MGKKTAATAASKAATSTTSATATTPATGGPSAKITTIGTNPSKSTVSKEVVEKMRAPVEESRAEELAALAQNDTYPKPHNWLLSPRMVELFITGTDEEFPFVVNGEKKKVKIATKYYGDKNIIQKAIVTLASERSLMLIGEPGTAKSWLSEHLSAAISGLSTYLVQGTAGTTEDQIRYSWNYALLVAEGPTPRALVPSPTINAMRTGRLLRFEELTRCPQEIQDCMVSILSEKVIPIPELGSEYLIFGKPGFNVIATANDRDRGVNEMSAALKRRFNFIYIPVIQDKNLEKKIVLQRTGDILTRMGFEIQLPNDVLDLLVTVFQELRTGKSGSGGRFTPISTVMSTSEEISVLIDSAIHAYFFGEKKVGAEHVAMNIVDAIVKDDKENLAKLREYLNIEVGARSSQSATWEKFLNTMKILSRD